MLTVQCLPADTAATKRQPAPESSNSLSQSNTCYWKQQMYGTMYGYLHTKNTLGRMTLESASKKTSCLSVCHPTAQSSSWGMLCLRSVRHSGGVGPPSPQPPSPTSWRTMPFFSEPHLLPLLTNYSVTCFLKRFSKIFLTIRKYGAATSRYFTPFLLPHRSLMC